jgi:hypothetical protein
MKKSTKAKDFLYVRGRFLLKGQTREDRRCALIDCILSWIYRLLIALALLITAVAHLVNHADGHRKRVVQEKVVQHGLGDTKKSVIDESREQAGYISY